MYKKDLALNNQKELIHYKTQQANKPIYLSIYIYI